MKDYPDNFLPEFRKKRSYLSSNLSKHEINSTSPYNKKMFKRLYRGYYELDPDLAVWVNDQWMNVYDVMQSEEVKVPTREERDAFIKEYYRKLREENRRLRERNGWDDELDDEWYDDDLEEKWQEEPEADLQKSTDRRGMDPRGSEKNGSGPPHTIQITV